MDSFRATGLAEGFIETDNEDEIIEAWQHLLDTRLCFQLQGWFGRTARDLVKSGVIEDKENAFGLKKVAE